MAHNKGLKYWVKVLLRTTERYEKNYKKRQAYIRWARMFKRNHKKTKRWKRLIKEEDVLNRLGIKAKKKLGIYMPDPCENYKCKLVCPLFSDDSPVKDCPLGRWTKRFFLEEEGVEKHTDTPLAIHYQMNEKAYNMLRDFQRKKHIDKQKV